MLYRLPCSYFNIVMYTGVNERLQLARRLIERTGESLFLTGKAGTGKTTFLQNLKNTSRKRIMITAPTGIAAINAGGVTLHSFFQLDFAPFIPGMKKRSVSHRFNKEKIKIIRGMDLLVIDEISMVRSDVLDAVDGVLRRYRDRSKPFGGVQLLMIGDLYQLAPVVKEEEQRILKSYYDSNYFFDSKALQQIDYRTIELTDVFRQKEGAFLDILNAIRENRVSSEMFDTLNSRYRPGFSPANNEGYIRLTTHNVRANRINDAMMESLETPELIFEATVKGNFPESSYPADMHLRLKTGAQVMFIKNDTGSPRRYYNGMIGHVVAIDPKEGVAVRPVTGGDIINVEPLEWDNMQYTVNEETKEIEETKVGSFIQYPLRSAWAVTIHKSQGLTFDRAIIDAEAAFAPGQTYVALSRCRTLEGIVLDSPVTPKAILSDIMINRYMDSRMNEAIDEARIISFERQYQLKLLDDLFSFRPLLHAMEGVYRLYLENFHRIAPEIGQEWKELHGKALKDILEVADKFRTQYSQLVESADIGNRLAQRVRDASLYFLTALSPLRKLSSKAITNHANKTVVTKLKDRLSLFNDILLSKLIIFDHLKSRDFNIDIYLDLKAEAMLRNTEQPGLVNRKKKSAASPVKLRKQPDKSIAGQQSSKAEVLKVKEKRVPSWSISVEKFKEGLSIKKIAEERGMVESTIFGHLAAHLTVDELNKYSDRLFRPGMKKLIIDYLNNKAELPSTMSLIREELNEMPDYSEIKLALAITGKKLSPVRIVEEPQEKYDSIADIMDSIINKE